MLFVVGIVQIGLILGYVYHQSTLSHVYYQHQKAEHTYQELLTTRDQLKQSIQSDHDYTRILRSAQQRGMRPIRFNDVSTVTQGRS